MLSSAARPAPAASPASRAQVRHRGRGQVRDPVLGGGEAEGDARRAHAVALGGDRAGELVALVHEHVGAPAPDHGDDAPQRAAGADAREALGDDLRVALGLREAWQPAHQRRPGCVGRDLDAMHGQAEALDVVRARRVRRDEDLVARALARPRERHQGKQVAGVAGRREEGAHAP